MGTLSNAEAIHISTVLEDCIDQLIILGRLMPVPYTKQPDAEQVCVLNVPTEASVQYLHCTASLAVQCIVIGPVCEFVCVCVFLGLLPR